MGARSPKDFKVGPVVREWIKTSTNPPNKRGLERIIDMPRVRGVCSHKDRLTIDRGIFTNFLIYEPCAVEKIQSSGAHQTRHI